MSVPLTDLTSDYPDLDRKALALLKRIGVTSLVSLISLPVERIAGLLDFPFLKADKLKQSLIEQYCPAPRSGLSLYQVSHQLNCKFVQKYSPQAAPDPPTLSTGSKPFDTILGGGLRAGEICQVKILFEPENDIMIVKKPKVVLG